MDKATSSRKTLRVLIFLALSSHGFGHLSQVAPVINALMGRLSDAQLVIQSLLDQETISTRIEGTFHYLPIETDIGMVMKGALNVQAKASQEAYKKFHQHWDDKLYKQIELFQSYSPDIVIADIPYLPLFAAQQLNITNIAICSLNWADILHSYCGNVEQIKQIKYCYAQADLFITPEPTMPMSWLNNIKTVGMLVKAGQSYKNEIKEKLGLSKEQKLVLISLGGIDTQLSIKDGSINKNIYCLLQDNVSSLNMKFSDVVQSVDAVITKPGYGMFVELAWGAIPTLYVRREDWPEEPYLIAWLKKYCPAKEIKREQLSHGNFQKPLDYVLQDKRNFIRPEQGIQESVSAIIDLLKKNDQCKSDKMCL